MQTSAKKIFCFIRYSILVDNQTQQSQWCMGRELSFEALREALFAKTRLDQHLFLFRNITLPALQSSTSDGYDLRVVVLTSTELPQPHLRDLHEALEPYPFAHLSFVDTAFGAMEAGMLKIIEEQVQQDEVYASIRLDDDDAISRSFVKELGRYIERPYSDMAISFPLGYSAFYDPIQRKLTRCCETYDPMNAQGLALISTRSARHRHVFEIKAGGHAKSDRRLPVILLGHTHGWLRVIHNQSSVHHAMGPEKGAKRLLKKRHVPIDGALIARDIAIDPKLFSPASTVTSNPTPTTGSLLYRLKHLCKPQNS